MARITVEDCLTKENNRFALVQLAAKRTKQILGGAKALVTSSNKAVVTSLREIAKGQVRFMNAEELAEHEAAELAAKEQTAAESLFEPVTAEAFNASNIREVLGSDDDDDDDIIDELEDDDDDEDTEKKKKSEPADED